MTVTKIDSRQLHLPPAWMSRVIAGSGAMGNAGEIRKILGEPLPQIVDPKDVPPEIMAMFTSGGLLERLRKKLSIISRKRGRKILPAKGTIASVDEQDNLYVGVDFLEQYGKDEELVAGILAHEWGHMLSDLPKGIDWSHLNYDELHALRRDEEADADGFAGRALFLMGCSPDPMIELLKKLDKKKKDAKLPNHKYHNVATRNEILRQAWDAEMRAMEVARKLFFQGKDASGAKVGRVIGAG